MVITSPGKFCIMVMQWNYHTAQQIICWQFKFDNNQLPATSSVTSPSQYLGVRVVDGLPLVADELPIDALGSRGDRHHPVRDAAVDFRRHDETSNDLLLCELWSFGENLELVEDEGLEEVGFEGRVGGYVVVVGAFLLLVCWV